MNHYAIGTQRCGAGWRAMVRSAASADFRPVTGADGRPLQFACRLSAKAAAADAVLRLVNGTMRRGGETIAANGGSARRRAEAVFRQGGGRADGAPEERKESRP